MKREDVDALAWDPDGPSQQIAWDEDGGVPGFGVRVYASGTKSFVVWVRHAGTGRKRLLTLGRVGELDVDEARAEAARLSTAFKAGVDPLKTSVGGESASGRGSESPALKPQDALRLLAAIDEERNPVVRGALRLFVYSDLSRSELLRARWEQLDREGGGLRTVGASEGERLATLSREAWSVIDDLPRRPGNPFLFFGRREGSHLSGLSRAWRAARRRAGMEDVSLDDLRAALSSRTPATSPTASRSSDPTKLPAPPEGSVDGSEDPSRARAVTPLPGEGSSAPSRRWLWAMPRRALGVEITPTRLRAYRGRRARVGAEVMEVEWSQPAPFASIAALRARFGSDNVLSLAIDMRDVFVKRLELPPLSVVERRRIITMDPRRDFPVLSEDLAAGVRDDDLVIAVSKSTVQEWTETLSALGFVERVESVPTALVRSIGDVTSGGRLLVLPDDRDDGVTLGHVEAGELTAVRKLPGGTDVVSVARQISPDVETMVLHPWRDAVAEEIVRAVPEAKVTTPPAPPGAPASFAAAYGALLGLAEGPELTLMWPALERRLRSASRRRAVMHVAALLLAFGALLMALDVRRSATLRGLETSIDAAEVAAEPVLELSREAAAIRDDLALLADEMTARANVMDALLEVSRLLPPDAYLTQLSSVGPEWELTGLAEDAAVLIPIFEDSPSLSSVRFRTATTRIRAGDRMLDRFTLVFRHVPPA